MIELIRFLDTTGIIQKENCILLRKKKHNPHEAENIQQNGTGEPVVSVHLRGSVCKLQTGKVGCWIFLTLSCPAENGTHLLPVNTDKSELQRTSLSSCDCVGKTQADFSWARQKVWKQIWGENSTFYPEKTLNETSLGWSILRKALQEKDKKGMHWTPQSAVSQRFVFSPSFFLFSLHPIHFHWSITT